MIYLDSSALLKLLFEEAESVALATWLTERAGTPWVSSELARVEVVRVARRLDPAVAPAARRLVDQLDLVPMQTRLLDEAADGGDPQLRALDAIHLATALTVRAELTAFVAYDHRLLIAARVAGVEPVSPS